MASRRVARVPSRTLSLSLSLVFSVRPPFCTGNATARGMASERNGDRAAAVFQETL